MFNLFSNCAVAIVTTTLSAAAVSSQLPKGAVATHPAQATITYDFTVNVTQGSLAGKSFNGTFRYNNASLKGVGVEELGVAQGLTVCMNYFGRSYRETDDTSYPKLPKLVFENGKIRQLDFWIQPNKRVNWWNLPGWQVKLSQRQATASIDRTIRKCY